MDDEARHKIAFLIDGSQTIQTIFGVLCECLKRNYQVDVYATCNISTAQIKDFPFNDNFKNNWHVFPSPKKLIKTFLARQHEYTTIFGINFFNRNRWGEFYQLCGKNVFILEHCWNEIYNCNKDTDSNATVLAHSLWSAETLQRLSNYESIKFIGGSWFETITRFKQDSEKRPGDYIVVLAPHDSYYSQFPNIKFGVAFKKFMSDIKAFCNEMQLGLVIKTREKYRHDYQIHNQHVVGDQSAFNHLFLYSGACCVFNFCSSAISELAFLEIPYVCVFPELHSGLHTNTRFENAVSKIYEKYYKGEIFDGIHCDKIPLECLGNDLDKKKIKDLIQHEERNWQHFQQKHYPGNHSESSARILDYVEKMVYESAG